MEPQTELTRIYFPYFPGPARDGAAFVVVGLIRNFLKSGSSVELVFWKGPVQKSSPETPFNIVRLFNHDLDQEGSFPRIKRVFESVFSTSSSPEEYHYPRRGLEAWEQLGPAKLAIYNYGFSWNWLGKGRGFGPEEFKRVVFHHNLESDLSFQRMTRPLSLIHWLNYQKLKLHEIQLQNLVDENWFISKPDLDKWIERGGDRNRARCHFPDLFEEDYQAIRLKRSTKTDNSKTPVLGFLGRLDFSPNTQSLNWILKHICPALASKGFKGKIRVIGRNASSQQKLQMAEFPFIIYEGFQESLDSFWTELDWLLVPHLEGSGVRVKLIESLMYHIPSLTHLKAAERLSPELQKSPYLRVEENPSRWVELILSDS